MLKKIKQNTMCNVILFIVITVMLMILSFTITGEDKNIREFEVKMITNVSHSRLN